MNKFTFILALLLFIPAISHAHGLATTQSQTIGNYDVEFEYNTIGNIFAGDYTLYDVYLLHSGTRDGIDFDSAFIRIEKQNGPAMLAGNLAQAADIKGYASVSGVLNDPGIYTAEVSVYKSGKTLAEAKFDYVVEKFQIPSAPETGSKGKGSLFRGVLVFILGLIVCAAVMYYLLRKRTRA
ncbi:MAG: hypothetical protein ABI643_03760 [Candidatus Doudnabacteria bacterium]